MSSKTIILPTNNQWLAGYITYTITDKENVAYGPFKDLTEAVKWSDNLINAIVIPVYVPCFNQG